MTPDEISELKYAQRNHGRNFVTDCREDTTRNPVINRLTDAGLFQDGGPSTFGRWRELTPAGVAALASLKCSKG